ncbi:hypothetical protein FHA64_16235 [Escherichia coli]|nr:hypothetical protein [Escherichia coli]
MASVSISCPSCSATDGVVRHNLLLFHRLVRLRSPHHSGQN